MKSKQIVDRLRHSLDQSNDALYAAGQQHGRHWAENRADVIHLERLERADRESDGWVWDGFNLGALRLFEIIEPDEPSTSAMRDFWNDIARPHQYGESIYIRGFVSAALELWEKLSTEVYS